MAGTHVGVTSGLRPQSGVNHINISDGWLTINERTGQGIPDNLVSMDMFAPGEHGPPDFRATMSS